MAEADSDTNSKIFALRAAGWIGCSGAHKHNGKWMPCETHEELTKLSGDAEPKKKTAFSELQDRYNTRRAKGKKKRKKGWENLRETKPLGGFATLEGGGIVSAPIGNMIPMGRKSYIPGVSPRDNDPDVFTDIESARKRSRMLGCIGVRRMPSSSGRTVWMPCTNNSDYSRLAGTTFLGRRNQQESQRRAIRTIIRREFDAESKKRKLRNKSLFEELTGTKGIGRAIGQAIKPGSMARRLARSTSRISGELNPFERRDKDKDGIIFDGTWREMPDPTAAVPPKNLMSFERQSGRPEEEVPFWAAKRESRSWFNASKIQKGGKLKASTLLDFDRLRLRRDRNEQARALGVTRETIDALHEPDASIDPFDADKLTMAAFNMHPALIWGSDWLESDAASLTEKPVEGIRRPLDDRDRRVLEMRSAGATLREIAEELGVSRERARQILNKAKLRNEAEGNGRTSRSRSSSASDPINRPGQIPRDSRGNILEQGDKRKETLDKTVEKLKSIGFTEEEINLLMTGDPNTPVEARTPKVDPRQINRNPNRVAMSMSLSQLANSSSNDWPQNQKNHFVDWANSRPSFNVPYSLAQKYKKNGSLTDSEWKRLLFFYRKYGPENRTSRSESTWAQYGAIANVGGKRMGQIILNRVLPQHRNKKPGERTHHHIVGPGGMGKSTLNEYLVKTQIIPNNSQAAHVDPDFIKQGIEGYNGGRGSEAVHRTSARAATATVNQAAQDGMDIVTEGTGYRLYEYSTTRDNSYKKVVHVAYAPYSVAEKRVQKRNAEGKRQLPVSQVRDKGAQLYGWLTSHLMSGEIQDMYIWDTDVPEGAAPRVIAKIEDGVFYAIDEPKFKKWSEQHGGFRGGDSNISWFRRRYPQK